MKHTLLEQLQSALGRLYDGNTITENDPQSSKEECSKDVNYCECDECIQRRKDHGIES